MRIALLITVILLTGCDHGFEFHPEEMTPEQMLQRADLVFIGVIEGQHFDSYPFFTAVTPAGMASEGWHPLRRRVRVETVLRGTYSAPNIDVYEVFATGGVSGNWNSTMEGGRYLFMVRKESGRWRIVRDWWRSIYEIRTGYHSRLPLDDSRPFWERYALMNFWTGSRVESSPYMLDPYVDPADALGSWRTAKLLRGLLRHPQARVRIAACMRLDETRDECENMFSETEWDSVYREGRIRRERVGWNAGRERVERSEFERMVFALTFPPSDPSYTPWAMDTLRILTTVNHPTLRREFCRTFLSKFPDDMDNGCSFDKPLPATIVTENGDVPLLGDWPR